MQTMCDVSVIIAAYADERWDDLVAAVTSVQHQTVSPRDIIVVIDHNPDLLSRARRLLPEVTTIENRYNRGAAGARNTGAAVAKGSVLVFLDDDAEALPTWIERLQAGYRNPRVLGIGGFIEPLWIEKRPRWFPEEFFWVVGGTYRGMPKKTAPVRNLWAGNMSVRRDIFESIGGFRKEFGKVGTTARPEDTDFCIQALQRWPDGIWLFEPEAKILHKVPPSRTTWKYFISRCYAEGLGKAELSGLVGPKSSLSAEVRHTMRTLPLGIARGLGDTLMRGDPAGVARASAILAGFTVTAVGYLRGLSSSRQVTQLHSA